MEYKKRVGDRKDGRKLRSLDPYNKFALYIMKTRNDANNLFTDSIEVTEIDRYLRKKRIEGFQGIGILHLFTAAYVRVISQWPGVNRFISGQKIYARNNIELVMTVKKSMSVESGETSVKVVLDPMDTTADVYNKINAEIKKVKDGASETNTDNVADTLMKIPGLVLKFVVFFLNIVDYFGLLPQSLIDASPFHGSLIITDLGSIGLPTLYHHLYNFGNIPMFISLGAKRKVNEIAADGTVVQKKYVDFSLTLDERICDGFYFSQAYKMMKSFMKNPELLDFPPETAEEDVL